MSRALFAWVLFSCALLAGCVNPALDVASNSLSEACIGASIGSRTTGSITNAGETRTAGSVRYRWTLSADALPSTDDVAMLGSGADVTIDPLDPGEVSPIAAPNLIVPGSARLGPQYLILVAVDLGDTEAGVGYHATPITINQCPSPAACDVSYPTESAYLASPHHSAGTWASGRTRARPVFLSDKSTLPVRGLTVGGREGARGLLLRYRADRSFLWGKSLSHCTQDSVDSVATFNDGSLAVVTSYRTKSQQETALAAYTQSGTLLWQRVVDTAPCPSCGLSLHGVVAVDPSDDTAVVAASNADDGAVEFIRLDRYGNELQRRTYTSGQLPYGGAHDIATYRWATGSRSDILLGFQAAAVLLDPSLNLVWTRSLEDLDPGFFPYSDVEVEICNRSNYYFVTTGVEYFSGQDVLRNYDRTGVERWAVDVQHGVSHGGAPPYAGPLGVVRPSHFALRCNEQELPELSFQRAEGGRPFDRDLRAVTFLHTGAVFRKYRGTFPSTLSFVGAAGIDASALDFLALGSNKFSLRSRTALAWTSY